MIYGDRLRLRAAERIDLASLVAWLIDPEVIQFRRFSMPLSLVQEEEWFENMQKQPEAEQCLVIEIKENEGWKAIGNTSFMGIDWKDRQAEIGIFIGEKSYWNQGYGRDTMRLMLKYGFEELNLNRIWLRVYEHNARGIRAYMNAGFVHEGKLRQAHYQDGRYYDVFIMSVLRDEWFQKNPVGS
jgi:RimJ/RimL family protein N-acetyltransferase